MVFEKTNIGKITVSNRIFRSATHDGMAHDGRPTQELIKKYANLAKNDVGCIITGYAGIMENGMSPYPKMLKIHKDEYIDDYAKLVQAVHNEGAPIVLQIAHCGRQTSSKAIGAQKIAPSAKMHLLYPDKAKAASEKDIENVIKAFGDAAVRAEKAGFDGVQLHMGHGYLLHDFLSPYGNNREDKWGGSTDNRYRIVDLIIREIKSRTNNIPLWVKMSAQDNRKGGMNISEALKIAKLLEKSGCDAIEVSCGTVEDGMSTMRSEKMPMEAVFKYRSPICDFPKPINKFALACANIVNPLIKQPKPLENFNVDNAQLIKNEVNIPIIVVGGIHRLDDMEYIITGGKADFVSMCRPFICEPNLVKKLKEKKQDSAKCIMCNYCGLVIEKEKTRCLYGKIK